jgi:hypothetical protein
MLISSLLQVLVQQSTERHDSEHRGSAVVASATVSWNRSDDSDVFLSLRCLNRELAVFVDFAGRCTTMN